MSNCLLLSLDVAKGFQSLLLGGPKGQRPVGVSDAAVLECRADEYLLNWPSEIINNGKVLPCQCQGKSTVETMSQFFSRNGNISLFYSISKKCSDCQTVKL